MSQFTPAEIARLRHIFLSSTGNPGAIDGSDITAGTLGYTRVVDAEFVAPGELTAVETTVGTAQAAADAAQAAANAAQATANTAFGWGNHADANYLTAVTGVHQRLTGASATMTLTGTAVGALFVVHTPVATGIPAVWVLTTNYTFVSPTINFTSAALADDTVDVFYVTNTT